MRIGEREREREGGREKVNCVYSGTLVFVIRDPFEKVMKNELYAN